MDKYTNILVIYYWWFIFWFQRCMDILETEISDEEVQNEAENCMEIPGDSADDVLVQN